MFIRLHPAKQPDTNLTNALRVLSTTSTSTRRTANSHVDDATSSSPPTPTPPKADGPKLEPL